MPIRLLLLATLSMSALGAQSFDELLTVPNGLGVNIHFTNPRPGEMEMLAAAGFRWVRMDFTWAETELRVGEYNFAAYDRLMAALDRFGIRALLILDYGNPLYDQGLAPYTEEGRKAFARWAVAAALQYKDRGVLWEVWNEPNLRQFWKPQPNAQHYARLARQTCEAIHQAVPGSLCMGPATSRIPLDFIGQCFDNGLLNVWDAVSVHPYRAQAPETALPEYENLRQLMRRHTSDGPLKPVISGEWGFSSISTEMTPERQGDYLARQFLANLSAQIPISIWYDWRDDGIDPKEKEHHFGTVGFQYHAGRDPVYDPKPAWLAARQLTSELNGYRFEKRLPLDNIEDFALVFTKGPERKAAVWTIGEPGRETAVCGAKRRLTSSPQYVSCTE